MVFRLRPIIDNDRDVRVDDLGDGHREITVYCHVMNAQGLELATGVGSCSTKESKFRYRGGHKVFIDQPVPREYWDAKKAGDTEKIEKLIGKGMGVGKNPKTDQWEICEMGEKMENPDIADTYNTVLKMAKKRAYVDGILSATAASDIFTQDIEDFPEAQTAPTKQPIQQPQAVEDAETYLDIITMLRGTKGAKLNVIAYGISVKHGKVQKKDKSATLDISEYTVGDLPKDHTATAVIKVFGTPLDVGVGAKIKFNNVEVGEYNGKLQYTAKEAIAQ